MSLAADLRTPALHPRTLEWLSELRNRLERERATEVNVFLLRPGDPAVFRRGVAAQLRAVHDRREFLRTESLLFARLAQ